MDGEGKRKNSQEINLAPSPKCIKFWAKGEFLLARHKKARRQKLSKSKIASGGGERKREEKKGSVKGRAKKRSGMGGAKNGLTREAEASRNRPY